MEEEIRDERSRKWLLTINNPETKGITNELIEKRVQEFGSFRYACYSHEVGKKDHTHHVHIFIAFDNQVRFNTIKKAFPPAHIDKCKGTIKENKDYVFKEGKWKGTEKEDTRIEGEQYEVGVMPIEVGQGHRTDMDEIERMLEDGMTPNQIFAKSISYRNFEKQIRAQYMQQCIKNTPVKREVTVIWHVGESGTGKSYSMVKMMEENEEEIYIMNDYDGGGLDLYEGQKILFMDEFRGQLKYSTLLNMLDGYKTQIHCRYANVYALWTEVHITSVLPPEMVYRRMVAENQDVDTIQQLLRRLTYVDFHYKENGEYKVFRQNASEYKDYKALQRACGYTGTFEQTKIDFKNL